MGEILIAGIAVEDRGRDQGAGAVVGAGKGTRQHLAHGAHGAVIGMPPPADIRKIGGRLADTPQFLPLAFKQRLSPLDHLERMRGNARQPVIGADGEFEQGIAGAVFGRQARIEQAFAQAVGRDHHILDVARHQQPLQNHGAIGQRFGAALGDNFDLAYRFPRQSGQHLAQAQRPATRDGVLLQDMERIIMLLHVHPGEAAPDAAHRIKRRR